jgi:tRNA 2-selenouridine synthase
VRSPSEFSTGHIPGAYNIPLFDDKEREAVGLRYKKEGRIKAIIEGLKLSGPSMHLKLEQALKISKEGRLLVHCWRGGMRSEAMAWLFSLGGIETNVLEGGYKSYRHFVHENLSVNRNMIILGGLTGSGKTHILGYLKDKGHQVIDLEGLANHKGSAFGSLGQLPQPSSENFSNLLFNELKHIDPYQPVWLEDESRNIGTVFMPEEFYLNMQKNPAVILLMDIKTRLPRLIEEYSCYSSDELVSTVMKISKRLGGDRTKEVTEAVQRGDFAKAIEITLNYYDKAYLFGLERKQEKDIYYVNTDTDDIETNARRILDVSGRITR